MVLLFSFFFFFFFFHQASGISLLRILSVCVCHNCSYIWKYLSYGTYNEQVCLRRIAQTQEQSVKTVKCRTEAEMLQLRHWMKLVMLSPHMGLSGKGYPRFIFIFTILCWQICRLVKIICIAEWDIVLCLTLQQMACVHPSYSFLNCIYTSLGTDFIVWRSEVFSNILMQKIFFFYRKLWLQLKQLNELFWAWLKVFNNFFVFTVEFL